MSHDKQKPIDEREAKAGDATETGTPHGEPLITLGEELRRARETKGLSLAAAADATRIHATTLAALEAGNTGALPAQVYTRGFVRIYAAHLGLDPDQALRRHIEEQGLPLSTTTEKVNIKEILASESMAEAPRRLNGNHVFLLLLGMLAIFLTYWGYSSYFRTTIGITLPPQPTVYEEYSPEETAPPEPEPPFLLKEGGESDLVGVESVDSGQETPPTRPAATPPAPRTATPPQAAPSPQATQATTQVTDTGPKAADRPEAAPEPPPADQPAAQAEPQAAAPRATPEVATTREPTKSPVAAPHVLTARFSEDTWIRIQIDDEPARQLFFQDGDSRTWEAEEQFDLRIGNAGGVRLTYNGSQLPSLGRSGQAVNLRLP